MMSKTAALAAAQAAVGRPHGRGTSWCLYHPWHDDKLNGPSTEMRGSSYAALRQARAERDAELALALMGVKDAGYTIAAAGPMSAKAYVELVLA
jgi:hypothetical protein